MEVCRKDLIWSNGLSSIEKQPLHYGLVRFTWQGSPCCMFSYQTAVFADFSNKTGAFEACRDSVRWGLYGFVICWSMLITLDRCHFGQRTILWWTWLCWYSTCSRFWPVLDAEALLRLRSSNFVILNFSRFYFSPVSFKKTCTSKPHIPGLHTQPTCLWSRSLHKRVAIADAMSISDMVLQSTYNTSGPIFMSMNASASHSLSRWSAPHGGCGG